MSTAAVRRSNRFAPHFKLCIQQAERPLCDVVSIGQPQQQPTTTSAAQQQQAHRHTPKSGGGCGGKGPGSKSASPISPSTFPVNDAPAALVRAAGTSNNNRINTPTGGSNSSGSGVFFTCTTTNVPDTTAEQYASALHHHQHNNNNKPRAITGGPRSTTPLSEQRADGSLRPILTPVDTVMFGADEDPATLALASKAKHAGSSMPSSSQTTATTTTGSPQSSFAAFTSRGNGMTSVSNMTVTHSPLNPSATTSSASAAAAVASPCCDSEGRSAAALVPSSGSNNGCGPQHDPQSYFEATEVMNSLYLGTTYDADDENELLKHNIKRVLNVARECTPKVEASHQIRVKKIPLKDHSDENISEFFDEALGFIREGIEKGEAVLVHCRQGFSRSATFVLAYLMKYGVDSTPSNSRPPSRDGSTTVFAQQQQQQQVEALRGQLMAAGIPRPPADHHEAHGSTDSLWHCATTAIITNPASFFTPQTQPSYIADRDRQNSSSSSSRSSAVNGSGNSSSSNQRSSGDGGPVVSCCDDDSAVNTATASSSGFPCVDVEPTAGHQRHHLGDQSSSSVSSSAAVPPGVVVSPPFRGDNQNGGAHVQLQQPAKRVVVPSMDDAAKILLQHGEPNNHTNTSSSGGGAAAVGDEGRATNTGSSSSARRVDGNDDDDAEGYGCGCGMPTAPGIDDGSSSMPTMSRQTSSSGEGSLAMEYQDAFDFVKNRRNRICPNLGFVLALKDLEQRLRGTIMGDEMHAAAAAAAASFNG